MASETNLDIERASAANLLEHAQYMSKSPDLWLCNKFSALRMYNVLLLQQELHLKNVQLQEHLGCPASQAASEATSIELSQINEDIRKTLRSYDDAVEQLARLNRFENPSKAILKIFDYRLAQHTENNAFAVELGFYEYDGSRLKKKVSNTAPDMLAIAACPKTWLHRKIERHDILRRMFKVRKNVNFDLDTYEYSEKLIKRLEQTIVASFFCILQIFPVVSLSFISNKTYRIPVVFILVGLVTLVNAVFPQTARETNFGAIASYAAILLVFTGQSN